MTLNKIGMRVGALKCAKMGFVEMYGYGVYEGDFVPPKETGGFNIGIENPRIKLDNGDVVYGCECWWGEEVQFKKKFIEKAIEVKIVSIAETRKQDKELQNKTGEGQDNGGKENADAGKEAGSTGTKAV